MCALLALCITSCSATGNEQRGRLLPAAQVCESLLPPKVAGKLDALAGLREFTQHHPRAIGSFASRLRGLEASHRGQDDHELCRVTADVEKSRLFTVAIYFQWFDAKMLNPRSKQRGSKTTPYPLGVHGEAYDFGATIYFSCPLGKPTSDGKLLRAGLWTANTKLTGQAGRNARITILNAAARKIARQLDCLDTANLPETFHKVT
ncbi:hypothetical protein [Streptomyces syringium]|uniref:Uncharacterized protein n=1 Tax=Streptomyces syringium TaxID=76729 RepID=A0ABS4Y9N0_9ACTN|nr:hypothetical protein [Streptomyces syringium]MBP2405505.1 hypothetical protein [Streptomyces syringium]